MQSTYIAKQSNSLREEFLGSGYDVCGEYGDGASIKKKIFDLSKVPSEYIREIPNTEATYFSVEGQSYQEFQKDLSTKVDLSGNYGLFSGSVKASFSSTDLAISESGFVSIKLFEQYTTWKLQTSSQEYMYKQVIEDFQKLDGLSLVEQYGGAVLMGMDVGGQWSDNFSVSKLYDNATSNVSTAIQAAYGFFVSGKGSAEISQAVKKQKSITSRRVNVVGGDPQYVPGELDKWQASVKENPAFMNFTPDGLVWIWQLFPEHEEKLQKGLQEYVDKCKLNIATKCLVSCDIVDGFKYTSDARSQAKQDLNLYKPSTSSSYKYVGVNGNDNKCLLVEDLDPKYGALRPVTEWQQVWNDRGSPNKTNYSCWIPKPPPQYVALGIYCRFDVSDQKPPSDQEAEGMVVVHESLVLETHLTAAEVWSDDGSKAEYDLVLGRKPNDTLWPVKTTDPEAGILPSMYAFKDKYVHVKNN